MTAPSRPIVVEQLESAFTLHRLWEQPDQDAFIAAMGPRIRGMATSAAYGRIDDRFLARFPALEIVASFGVGYDNVDVAAAAARGVVVTNTPGVLDEEVADLTVALLLATVRQLPQAERFLREGQWLKRAFPLSPTLRGRRVGIVGLGNIGKAVARRLQGFDVPIAYHGRHRQDVPFEYHSTVIGLAEASDVLVVIVPGGAGTRHMIYRDVLAALGPDGVLINVARGSVVDEAALIEALQAGTILSAGLDVYADEPRVPQALLDLPNLVLLPHVGSASVQTRDAMGRLLAGNLVQWFHEGTPVTSVAETAGLVAANRDRHSGL